MMYNQVCFTFLRRFTRYKSMGFFYTPKGSQLCSPWLNPAKFRTYPKSHEYHRYLQVWNGSDQKHLRKPNGAVFPL